MNTPPPLYKPPGQFSCISHSTFVRHFSHPTVTPQSFPNICFFSLRIYSSPETKSLLQQPHLLPLMLRRQPVTQRIRFVGDTSLYWESETSWGTRSWNFLHQIDSERIFVGADIAIMRNHPLHQDSLDSGFHSLSDHTSHPRPRPVLVEGKVLGIRRVRKGVVTFTVAEEISGRPIEISVPASRTTISPDGGLYAGARPFWGHRGPVVRYPTWVWAHDLQRPMENRTQFMRTDSLIFAYNV